MPLEGPPEPRDVNPEGYCSKHDLFGCPFHADSPRPTDAYGVVRGIAGPVAREGPGTPEPCLRGDGTRCAYADGDGSNCGQTCALRRPASVLDVLTAARDEGP